MLMLRILYSHFCWRMTKISSKNKKNQQIKRKFVLKNFLMIILKSKIWKSDKVSYKEVREKKNNLQIIFEFSTFHSSTHVILLSVYLNKFHFQLIHENLFPQWYFNFHFFFVRLAFVIARPEWIERGLQIMPLRFDGFMFKKNFLSFFLFGSLLFFYHYYWCCCCCSLCNLSYLV